MTRSHGLGLGLTLAFVASGVVVAVVTCGGILEERLSSGSPAVGLVANVLVTLASVLLLAAVQRARPLGATAFVLQALGATSGIALVHLALRLGVVAAPAWFSERPPQLVNDAVAVFSTLAVVWACAASLSWRLLLVPLGVLTVYRATSRMWHLDAAPHGFIVTVQDFVLAQFVAAALAVAIYRVMTRRAT